jgi:multidrug transporter EmrE-like cation transporter
MQLAWLVIAISATVAYHVVLKVMPATANPFLSLAVTYASATLVFLVLYAALPGHVAARPVLHGVNWTALALAVTVVLLDLGFLMLYRAGFNISLGQLITQSVAALVLVAVGVAFFRERVTVVNVGGIALCIVGLWMINRDQ